MEVVVAVPPPPPPSPPPSSSSIEFNFDSNCSSPYITAPSSPQRFENFFFTRRHSSASASASAPNNTHDHFQFQFQFNSDHHLHRPSLSADQLFLAGKIRPLQRPSPSQTKNQNQNPSTKTIVEQSYKPQRCSSFSVPSTHKGYRKWRLKDFLLFRPSQYAVMSKTTAHQDVRNMSFRSADSSGSVSRRRGPVSAHELHYTVNRAASVEMKKKTLLPYKQGLFGCLGFNHGMLHFTALN